MCAQCTSGVRMRGHEQAARTADFASLATAMAVVTSWLLPAGATPPNPDQLPGWRRALYQCPAIERLTVRARSRPESASRARRVGGSASVYARGSALRNESDGPDADDDIRHRHEIGEVTSLTVASERG